MDSLVVAATALKIREDVVEAARDLMRLMHLKLQPGSLRRAECCRHVLALDLASLTASEPCKRESLLLHAGIPNKDYSQALMMCKNILNIKTNESVVQSLSILCGCESIVEVVSDLLEKYEANYVSKLVSDRRKNINLESSVYQAAAFLLATKLRKVAIDKRRVVEAAGVQNSVFYQVYDSIAKFASEDIKASLPATASGAGRIKVQVMRVGQ